MRKVTVFVFVFFYDLALSLCPGHGKEFRVCSQVSM